MAMGTERFPNLSHFFGGWISHSSFAKLKTSRFCWDFSVLISFLMWIQWFASQGCSDCGRAPHRGWGTLVCPKCSDANVALQAVVFFEKDFSSDELYLTRTITY